MVFLERPQDFSPIVEVTSVYIEYRDKVLFMKRHPDKAYGDTYDLPGGKIEKGESKYQAAIRELFEETGIEVPLNDLDYQKTFYVKYSDLDFIYHTFKVKMKQMPKVIINNEHTETIWLTPIDALSYPLIPDEDECLSNLYNLK